MVATLREMLLAPEVQPQVVADCQALVKQELSAKSGVSATAIKLAYKMVTTFAPGYYQSSVESMLPDMTGQLEPFWADFITTGGSEFGDYLAKRGDEVAEALLVVTDAMATRFRPSRDCQGLQIRPRRREQAHRDCAAEPRRHGSEVRDLTARAGQLGELLGARPAQEGAAIIVGALSRAGS